MTSLIKNTLNSAYNAVYYLGQKTVELTTPIASQGWTALKTNIPQTATKIQEWYGTLPPKAKTAIEIGALGTACTTTPLPLTLAAAAAAYSITRLLPDDVQDQMTETLVKNKQGRKPLQALHDLNIASANLDTLNHRAILTATQKQDPKEATDACLQDLSENLSLFLPFYAMIALGNIETTDAQNIVSLISEARQSKNLTVKQIFLNKYGKNLNWIQKAKIWIFDLFSSSFIFSKTIDAYLKQILEEMRARLSNAKWTERGDKIENLFRSFSHFLDVYKAATLAYANAEIPKHDLRGYREEAMQNLFQKSQEELSQELSFSLIYKICPRVQYFENESTSKFKSFCNTVLNAVVKKGAMFLLPKGISSVLNQADEATKPYHLPFTKAITDTITEQLEKLNATWHEKGSAADPLPGIESLTPAVENLLNVLEFAHCKTKESILAKKKELENRRASAFGHPVKARVEKGVREATIKGIHILLHHLAKPENSEEMFTQFFRLANTSFAAGVVVRGEDFERSREKLEAVARSIGTRLAREAVEEEISQNNPEKIAEKSEAVFSSEKQAAETEAKELKKISNAISQKAIELKTKWKKDSDIEPDLAAMRQRLKRFATQEQISKELKTVSEEDQLSIQRAMAPLYTNIRKQTETLLELEKTQRTQRLHALFLKEFKIILKSLKTIVSAKPPESVLDQFPSFLEPFERMSPYLREKETDSLTAKMVALKENFLAIWKALDSAQKESFKLKALEDIDEAVQKLSLPAKQKKEAIQSIENFLKVLPQEANQLIPCIQALSDRDKPEPEKTRARTLLKGVMRNLQKQFISKRKEAYDALDSIRTLQQDVVLNKQFQLEQMAIQGNLISKTAERLSLDVQAFENEVKNLSRETSKASGMKQHLGWIGGAATGVLSYFAPSAAAALTALVHTGAKNLGPILNMDESSVGPLLKTGAIAAGAAYAAGALDPTTALAATALSGSITGKNALSQAVNGIQQRVEKEINDLFNRVYSIAIGGNIYKPVSKILMNEVVKAYNG